MKWLIRLRAVKPAKKARHLAFYPPPRQGGEEALEIFGRCKPCGTAPMLHAAKKLRFFSLKSKYNQRVEVNAPVFNRLC
jgi:hypothetical protein